MTSTLMVGTWRRGLVTIHTHNEGADNKELFFGTTEDTVEMENPANTAPVFLDDQDRNTPGDQDETVTREVAENTDDGENIGDAFVAEDAGDLLTFELGGADADSFGLTDPTTGTNSGLLADEGGLGLRDEERVHGDDNGDGPTGASDMITVTVMVTDEDDGAVITLITGPAPEPGDTCGGGGRRLGLGVGLQDPAEHHG